MVKIQMLQKISNEKSVSPSPQGDHHYSIFCIFPPVKLKLTLKINSNKTHTRQNKKWPNFKPMNTGQTSFY